MWKYAAAIIANAVLVWGFGAFVVWDLNWLPESPPLFRMGVLLIWVGLSGVIFLAKSFNPTP